MNILLTFGVLILGSTSAAAFFIRWPWSFLYPGATSTTAVGAATINYGFLRPAVIVPVTTTTEATTTTTTTTTTATPTTFSQFLFNLLGNSTAINLPTNDSLLIALATAAATGGYKPPIISGIAQPYPQQTVIGGGGIPPGIIGGLPPGVIGGIAGPIQGGIAGGGIGGIAAGGGLGQGGILIPNGFPAGGGVLASGLLPGFFPGGILGKSSSGGRTAAGGSGKSSGKVIFASK